MIIKINSKKMIEGEKPVIDLQGPSPITLKTDQDFQSLSSSLYLAGSRVYGNSTKLLFLSKEYSINEDEVTFNVDTYTENYLKYINEFRTPFNLEFGAFADSKKTFLLDKAFANPRVYLEGVPPADLNDYYTKNEIDSILSSNYWTKYEVAQAIAQVQTMEIIVVEVLPPIEEAQEYTIYLVPSQDQSTGNVYDEYLVINHQYECIGSTAVDLSQYAKIDDLSGYLPLSGGTLSGDLYIPSAYVSGLIQNGVNYNLSLFATANDLSGYLPTSGIQYNTTGAAHNAFTIKDGNSNEHIRLYLDTNGKGTLYLGNLYGNPSINARGNILETNVKTVQISPWESNTLNIKIDGNQIYNKAASGSIFSLPSSLYVGQDLIYSPSGLSLIEEMNNRSKEYSLSSFSSATLSAESNTFYQSNADLTSLDLTITSGLTNALIFFTTGISFTFTSTIDANMYINEPFDFEPNGAYLIAIENKCIVWTQMEPR